MSAFTFFFIGDLVVEQGVPHIDKLASDLASSWAVARRERDAPPDPGG